MKPTKPLSARKTVYTLLSRTFAPATGAFLATSTDYLRISRTRNPHEPEAPTTGVFAHKKLPSGATKKARLARASRPMLRQPSDNLLGKRVHQHLRLLVS